jgi:shikimate dehydrogenase
VHSLSAINEVFKSATQKGGKVRLAVLGDPIAHSLSPKIHNEFIAQAIAAGRRDLQDAAYIALQVPKGELGNTLPYLWDQGVWGMNITLPHKVDVMSLISEIDPIAKELGAINTLIRTTHGWKGYNNDYHGLDRAIEKAFGKFSGAPVIIIGAGGAGRISLIWAMRNAGSPIAIINRGQNRLDDLLKIAPNAKGVRWENIASIYDKIKYFKNGLVLQCSSLGLIKDDEHEPALRDLLSQLGTGWKLLDMVYGAASEPLIHFARSIGIDAVDGSSMLQYQAEKSFSQFCEVPKYFTS